MKQMVKITKVDPFSLAKILGILYAFFGLIIGILMSLFMVVPSSMMGSAGGFSGLLMGLGVIITVPVFYGIMGFISGIIMAIPYNIIANWIGGLEVEVETKE